ncbi:MAG: uncharacterized protein JWN86_2739 [Planctomycetota bacterium]|nr:uncharacterized protein [Planctomycetota bacterium]
MKPLPAGILAIAVILGSDTNAAPQDAPTGVVQGVRFDQNLGVKLPSDLPFRDESGRSVRLYDLFGRRPMILTLVYYKCPMLCSQELNSLTRSLRALKIEVGKDFDILSVSISPNESPELASEKKKNYLARYDRAAADRGWHFLTGDESSIRRLADAAGFRYVYNPRTNLYAHAAGLVILSPDGTITRYFSGIDYPAKDLQLALSEAARGRVGSPIARMILLCYDYDPSTGKYTLAIMRLVQVLGTATVVFMAASVYLMSRRDRRRLLASGLPARPTMEH